METQEDNAAEGEHEQEQIVLLTDQPVIPTAQLAISIIMEFRVCARGLSEAADYSIPYEGYIVLQMLVEYYIQKVCYVPPGSISNKLPVYKHKSIFICHQSSDFRTAHCGCVVYRLSTYTA